MSIQPLNYMREN